MPVTGKKLTRILTMLAFLFCMFFANFYAIRKINHYIVEVYLYDKLLVAYNIGGKQGIKKELNKILISDKFPPELILAKDFKARFNDLEDPAGFLNQKSAQGKSKIIVLRNLRVAAIVLLLLIFFWRVFINFSEKRQAEKLLKDKKQGL